MTERDAFLAAIRATPDDDLPRLVFADWLDENGQPDHARAIRHYIHRRTVHTSAAGYPAELWLLEGEDGWAKEIAPAVPGVAYTVRRGFVSGVECRWADWFGWPCSCEARDRRCDGGCTGGRIGRGPELVRTHPIERVRFSDVTPLSVHNPTGPPYWTQGLYPHLVPWGYAPLTFESPEAAEEATSRQALAWARGHPPCT